MATFLSHGNFHSTLLPHTLAIISDCHCVGIVALELLWSGSLAGSFARYVGYSYHQVCAFCFCSRWTLRSSSAFLVDEARSRLLMHELSQEESSWQYDIDCYWEWWHGNCIEFRSSDDFRGMMRFLEANPRYSTASISTPSTPPSSAGEQSPPSWTYSISTPGNPRYGRSRSRSLSPREDPSAEWAGSNPFIDLIP